MLELGVCYYLKNDVGEYYFIADKYDREKYTGLSWIYYTSANTNIMGSVQAVYNTRSEYGVSGYSEVELAPRYIKHSCLGSVFNIGIISR
jgi:hypothetical protein